MAYVISDDCISCGTCEGECPAGAISEGDGKYEIDADTCMAVLVQVLAQQVLSARNNSLILRRTIIRGHRVCGVFFFCGQAPL